MSADHEFQHQASEMGSSSKGQATMSVTLASQQLSSTNKQIPQVDLLPRFHTGVPVSVGSQQFSSIDRKSAQNRLQIPLPVNYGPYQLLSTNKQLVQTKLPRAQFPISAYLGSQPLSSTNTRPSGMDPLLNFHSSVFVNLGPQPLNKRPILMEASPKFQTAVSVNPGFQQLLPNNKRPAQKEQPQKAQTESFESVRSKLRESLAASLAMVTPQQLQIVEKGGPTEALSIPGQAEEGIQSGKLTSGLTYSSLCGVSSGNLSSSKDVHNCDEGQKLSSDIVSNENTSDQTKILECNMEESQLKLDDVGAEASLSNNAIIKDELLQGHGLCWASDIDTEHVEVALSRDSKRPKLGHDEVTGDVKEMTFQNPETLAVETVSKRPNVDHEEVTENMREKKLQNSQGLALKIEAELFRLYGGVNKKYKEKARSLLFNLKDRNNPELRERVFSGEIAPERLCSMTAEELASKELSQWRLAKAEELAQMVVLLDSEVDIRRLVKKTHKGEFQVEVERDDSASVEVPVEASVLSQVPTKARNGGQIHSKSIHKRGQVLCKQTETAASECSHIAEKADSGEQNISNNLVVATLLEEKTDLMQELMGGELKDPALLPPIASLDEFMEALDSEPPFDNLSVDPVQDIATVEDKPSSGEKKEILDSEIKPTSYSSGPNQDLASDSLKSKLDQDSLVSKMASQNTDSKDPVEIVTDKPDKVVDKHTGTDSNLKPDAVQVKPGICQVDVAPKGESIWEGLLQLNISSLATVIGIFRSGERTSTREWPSFLEIKGRVRVDAFEKFLQELRLSRSRAIMIVQFCWKEGSPEDGRLNLLETVDSYIMDERVGFAEPVPGVELYVCPPHKRISEMLGRHLPKEQTDILLSAVNNGLIGVVVWRRPHVTISPKLPSQHKHSSSKTPLRSRRKNFSSSALGPSQPPLYSQPPTITKPPIEEPIDDVPPGFGPGSANDEDDLPEFDFVHTTSAPNLSRPSGFSVACSHTPPQARVDEKMRELVHRYGQSKLPRQSVLEVQPWNDDDDDDIPEWQPHNDNQSQLSHPQLAPAIPKFHAYQQAQPQLVANQHMLLVPPSQQPIAQSQVLHQQIAPMSVPLQPVHQPQMRQMPGPQNMHPRWQSAPRRPAWGPHELGLPVNGMMPPCHFGGAPTDGRSYGVPTFGAVQNGMVWRPDIPRSRGV